MAKSKKKRKRNPQHNSPPQNPMLKSIQNPLMNHEKIIGGFPVSDSPRNHFWDLYIGAMTLVNEVHSVDNKYLLNRNDRVYEAMENLRPEVEKRCNMNENLFDSCYIATGCYYPKLMDDSKVNTSIAYAFLLRFGIEKQEKDDCIKHLIEIEHNETVQKLKDIGLTRFKHCFRDICRQGTEEDFISLIKIVYFRLADNYMNYPKGNKKRYGPTWDLYQQILEMMPDNFLTETVSDFEKSFWNYTSTVMEIEKRFQTRHDLQMLSHPSETATQTPMLAEELLSRDITSLMTEDLECLLNLWLYYGDLGMNGKDHVIRLIEKVHANDILESFDPYTLCNEEKEYPSDPFSFFSGLCLCQDEDKDIAFIPGVVNSLSQIFTSQLPWGQFLFSKYKKTELSEYAKKSRNIYAPKIWYEYIGKNEDEKSYGGWQNISQVIYQKVGVVLLPSFQGIMEDRYVDTAWTEETAKLACAGIISEICEEEKLREIYGKYTTAKIESEQQNFEKETEKIIAKERESTEQKLRDMNDRLNEAKKETNKVDREKENLKKKLQESEQRKIKEHKELCSLREWVYNHLNEEEIEEEEEAQEEAQDDFPYGLEKRVVVFGGFENWRNELKDKIKNVTFAPKSDIINTDLIKNAESVWIQTNCISHSAFYNIQNIADTSDIPIKYFISAGVLRCARQLVEYDKEE